MWYFKTMKPTDSLSNLLSRGVSQIYPTVDLLKERLGKGPIRLYSGIDPTGPTLHLGHASILRKLRMFQDEGHHVVLLIGDFTALIGDPTGKFSTRKQLSPEEVKNNVTSYTEQLGRILNLDAVELRYNSEWLSGLSLRDMIGLLSEFTVQQMIERDMFEKRISSGEPVYVHEFLYPALQGYDSVALDVELEIGGSDQIFNMLAGRTLLKKRGKEKFVLATKLLTDPTGKKMGKTEGNMVALSDTPDDAFGKIMSWPDELMEAGFELLTSRAMSEARAHIEEDPKGAKISLAHSIVAWLWGSEKAINAQETFENRFSKGLISGAIPEVYVERDSVMADAVLQSGLVSSKSEWRRLVLEGAVEVEGVKVTDPSSSVQKNTQQVRIGKNRFLSIIVK